MATKIATDWQELFDVALFEPKGARLRQCIEHAEHAIKNRLDVLMNDLLTHDALTNDRSQSGRIVSERIALSDALTTLAELHNMVFCPEIKVRKSSASVRRENSRTADPAKLG
jgi:hypothetical protein